jgi:hypothetical protein
MMWWRDGLTFVGLLSFGGWLWYAVGRILEHVGRRRVARAYLIFTVDTRTAQIVHAGIYSCPASQLTMGGGSECKLDGISVEAEDFDNARKDLLAHIRMWSTFRWVLAKMPPGEKQP